MSEPVVEEAAALPLVSVVVPVRNMQETIARTLTSIVEQSYPNVEIIVIEGASTDDTLARIKAFGNQITTLVSEPDQGLYEAVNKGIALSRGEIVGILNGDDYYKSSDVLQLYGDAFGEHAVGLVYGDLEFFLASNPSGTIRRYSSEKFSPKRLRYGWMPPHPTVFVRRSVYEQVGQYRTDYKIAADFEFLVRALWKEGVPARRIPSVVVRMQYGGISTQGISASYRLNKEILRACRDNGLSSSWLRIALKIPSKLREFLP